MIGSINHPINTYKPTWVANSFLLIGNNEGVVIDPLKIQKLTYVLHGWHLAVTGVPVVGELFEAWPHGPVNSTIYQRFKRYRFSPIREYTKDIDPITGEEVASYVAQSDEHFYEVFNRVWDRYKVLTGKELSALTHQDGTPWTYAREKGLQYIPNELIQSHFVELSERAA